MYLENGLCNHCMDGVFELDIWRMLFKCRYRSWAENIKKRGMLIYAGLHSGVYNQGGAGKRLDILD